MRRVSIRVRDDWQKTVESQGLYYHTADDVPYWDESVYYEFTAAEIDELEAATYALDKMCLEAVEHVLAENRLHEFLIPPQYRDFLRASWDRDEHTIYGRFDLAYDGRDPPKLLEYNADTPTALLEAAVIQWYWLQDQFPDCPQFNNIHERLIEAWQAVAAASPGRVYFAALRGCVEDYMTVNYLRDTALQAGLATEYIDVESIGWNPGRRAFVDTREQPIGCCFKLYPWEWMQREQFGPYLLHNTCQWLEPPWKAILSNKAILPVLWELFPDSPHLLESSFTEPSTGNYVKKPIFSREGANIQIFQGGQLFMKTEGPYDGPAVFQEIWPLPRFDGRHFACVGSWMVNGWACGIGIREDESLITGNTSRFVPHRYRS
jgi:glutathionylspermidine synthase